MADPSFSYGKWFFGLAFAAVVLSVCEWIIKSKNGIKTKAVFKLTIETSEKVKAKVIEPAAGSESAK